MVMALQQWLNRGDGSSGGGHRRSDCGVTVVTVMVVMTLELKANQEHFPNQQRDGLHSGFWILVSEYRA